MPIKEIRRHQLCDLTEIAFEDASGVESRLCIKNETAESLSQQLQALGFGVKQVVKMPDEPKKKHSCDDPKCAVCGHPWAD